MKTIKAGKYRMLCLSAMVAGTTPTPAIVTVKSAAEAMEIQMLYIRSLNPTLDPNAAPLNPPSPQNARYCACPDAHRNPHGNCQHNSIYMQRKQNAFYSP